MDSLQERLALGDGLALRTLADDEVDYAQMAAWLSDERVLRYYGGEGHRMDAAGVRAHYSPHVLGREPVYPNIIERDEQPIGYLQFYPVPDPTRYGLSDETPTRGLWAIDLFIGVPELWGQGLGPRVLAGLLRFLADHRGATRVLIDPIIDNERAIRAYERVGFEKLKVLPAHEELDGVMRDAWLMHWRPGWPGAARGRDARANPSP